MKLWMKSGIMMLVLLVSLTSSAFAWTPAKVYLDKEEIALDPTAGVANNTTMVPFRPFFESLGATVTWDPKKKTLLAEKNETTILLTVNKNEAIVNGETIKLIQAPTIDGNNVLYVNLRVISESFGYTVDFDKKNMKIYVNSKKD